MLKKIFYKFIYLVSAGAIVVSLSVMVCASAFSNDGRPQAKISFTFDDGNASVYLKAAPILASYGLKATSYVTTACLGMASVPNTCKANASVAYMTWNQLRDVQNHYGWEIGSHTFSHPALTKLDVSALDIELVQSKADLATHGIDAVSFASPYGDYSPETVAAISKYYQSHRGFADVGYNWYPYDDYLIQNKPVQVGVTPADVKGYIDQAIADNTWLVLTFHDIKDIPVDSYDYASSDLGEIAAYVKTKQDAGLIRSVIIKDGIATAADNLFREDSFESPLSNGWIIENPSAVTIDSSGKGSVPDSKKSVRFSPAANVGRLYSPQIAVDSLARYLFKTYLCVTQIAGGEVNFYIDEYDSVSHWISGQNKLSESSVLTSSRNFIYQPSSPDVAYAQLQITATANSDIIAYIDNVQMFLLASNFIAGGTFEEGISHGWTTDAPSFITADGDGNGHPANSVYSVKLTSSSSGNGHLFSPDVSVMPGNSYTIQAYLDLRHIAGNEIGFYIDETDSAGNWISGQYIEGVSTIGKQMITLAYTPGSGAVASASLQIISPEDSDVEAYLDAISWYEN